jgi:hypothetical protein
VGLEPGEFADRLNPRAAELPFLRCAECGTVSPDALGWRGHRAGELDPDDEPEVLVFCPDCAERELGG